MTSTPEVRSRVLTRLQTELQSIYRVDSPLSVADFAINQAQWKHLDRDGTSEELLIREEDGALEVAVFIADDVLHTIDRAPDHWTQNKLRAHCLAVEGVSHFLYLTNRARLPRPVSQLELELQAEIDKFATVLLALWEEGNREAASALRVHLFERVSFKPELSREENDRYRQANFLASVYCRFLEARYIVKNSIDGFLADLRRMYRLGAGDKLSYAACGAAL